MTDRLPRQWPAAKDREAWPVLGLGGWAEEHLFPAGPWFPGGRAEEVGRQGMPVSPSRQTGEISFCPPGGEMREVGEMRQA